MSMYKLFSHTAMVLLSVFTLTSCSKFLDSNPNSLSVIPTNLHHLQLMLNNENTFNTSVQNMLLEIYTDDYLMQKTQYDALVDFDKRMYTFESEYFYQQAQINFTWSNVNAPVQYANSLLEMLPGMRSENPSKADEIEGAAYYYRGSTYYYQAQVYAPVYEKEGNNNKPGIPLRRTSDLNERSVRSTVQETYDAILSDLTKSVRLLPLNTDHKTQPDKATAYGFLARVCLSMQEYEQAGLYADSALLLKNKLIDFNLIDSTRNISFDRFNDETIFFSTTTSNNTYHQGRGGYIHPELYEQYDVHDLRRVIYFIERAGHMRFKGSYSGSANGTFMAGVSVDEMFFVRAEAHARAGRIQEAMNDLNTVLITRWRSGMFTPFTAINADEALETVLRERRKSLLMRGLRFTDIKRLNLDPRFAKTIVRTLGEGPEQETFTLSPGDKRYVFLFPQIVIEISGMPQTER